MILSDREIKAALRARLDPHHPGPACRGLAVEFDRSGLAAGRTGGCAKPRLLALFRIIRFRKRRSTRAWRRPEGVHKSQRKKGAANCPGPYPDNSPMIEVGSKAQNRKRNDHADPL